MKRTLGVFVFLLWSILCMVSCREANAYGSVSISIPDTVSRSILPENTRITYISVEGSMVDHPDLVLAKQYFRLGGRIDIQGLAAGTWSIGVTGYNGDPEADGVVVTTTSVDSQVSIRSGKTTQAYFALHYLREGTGSALVNLAWPNYSVASVLLDAKDSSGAVVKSTSISVSPMVSSAQIEIPEVAVGNYDVDVVLTNTSGTTISFPMIDMLNVFDKLQSIGLITLVDEDVPRVATPSYSVSEDGPEVFSRTLTLTSETPNARLAYTLDGRDPSIVAGNLDTHTFWYSHPFPLTSPVTVVKAMAVKDGYQDSAIVVSEELRVTGSDDEGGVVVSDPVQISNVVVTSLNEVYLENPQFQITYEMQNSPVLDSVVWYLNGTEVANGTSDTFTYQGYLPSGRHQLSVKVFYFDGSTVRSTMGTLRFNNNGQATKPVVLASEQDSVMQVSLLSEIPMAQIFFTADGSEPSRYSTLYTKPFITTMGSTVKALAVVEEYRDSEVVCTLVDNDGTLTVTMPSTITDVIVHADEIVVSKPRFSITYDRVNVLDETIAWYIDGNLEPSTDRDGDGNPATFTYGGKLSVGRHQVRVEITYFDDTAKQSAYGSLRFSIGQTTTPEITTSQVSTGKLVTLSCATEGASIYYTTTGNDPNTARVEDLYTEPFTVSLGTTVKTIAVRDGLADSPVRKDVIDYEVGDTGPSGGIVFLVDTEDTHDAWAYMEAAPNDEEPCGWGGYETYLGTTGTAVGTGATNTKTIIEALVDERSASKLCADKSMTIDGVLYDDWFLPSRDELDALYTCWVETGTGNFSDTGYWSSSEDTAYVSWMQNFTDGVQNFGNGNGSKVILNSVRAVRAF